VIKVPARSNLDVLGGDILPGDWVDGTVNRNGVDFPLFRGVVDGVRRSTASSGGATVRTFNLTGRDHGAPFEMPVHYANAWIQTLQQRVKGLMADDVKGKTGGSPGEMFDALIAAAFGLEPADLASPGSPQSTSKTKSHWLLPGSLGSAVGGNPYGTYFGQALRVDTFPTRSYYYDALQLWTHPGQTLADTLNQWSNPMLNEWYMDLSPRNRSGDPWQMWATLRERPFINREHGLESIWYQLPVLELPNWAISSTDLGRSIHERFNLFLITAQVGISQDDQLPLAPPTWDAMGIEKYGIRPMLETTKFVGPGAYGSWGNERRKLQDLLVDWHAPNPFLLNGTVICRLALPELHVGERFRIIGDTPGEDLTFRVEGIDFAWQWASPRVPPTSQTTIVLTRGYAGSDRDGLEIVQKTANRFETVFSDV
jgi:hypothetical protein